MERIAAAFAGVLLAASSLAAMAQGPASPVAASEAGTGEATATPDRIAYSGTGNGWLGGQTEWWIDGAGKGAYRTTIRRPASGRFDVGPQGFARIRAILRPLENVRELPCENAVTDQGMGTLHWRHGPAETALRFDFGCNYRQPDPARDKLGEAGALIEQWALDK